MNNNIKAVLVFLLVTMFTLPFFTVTSAMPSQTVVVSDIVNTDAFADLRDIIIGPDYVNFTGAFAPKKVEEILNASLGGDISARYAFGIFGSILVDLDRNMSTGRIVNLGRFYGIEPFQETNSIEYSGSAAIPGIDAAITFYYYKEYYPGLSRLETYYEIEIYDPVTRTTLTSYIPSENFLASNNASWISATIPWDLISELYYNSTGITVTPPYAVYLVAATPPEIWYDVPYSIGLYAYGSDLVGTGGVNHTIPEANITLDGSGEDWPAGPVLVSDIPEDYAPISGILDAQDIMIAANNDYFYVGVTLGSVVNFTKAFDYFSDIRYARFYLTGFNVDLNGDSYTDGWIEIYARWDRRGGFVFGAIAYNYNTRRIAGVSLEPPNYTGNVLEFAIPQSLFNNVGFNNTLPGSSFITTTPQIMIMSSYDIFNIYSLSPNWTVPPHVIAAKAIVDPSQGYVEYAGVTIGSWNRVINGSRINVMVGDDQGHMFIVSNSTVPSPVEITLVKSGTQTMSADLPTNLAGVGHYYFSLNRTDVVPWPLTVIITYNDQGIDEDTITVYYYSKTARSYVPIPEDLYTVNTTSNTITITYTLDLYNDGDPGISILAVPLSSAPVGGTLLPQGLNMVGIMAIIALAALTAGVIIIKRMGN